MISKIECAALLVVVGLTSTLVAEPKSPIAQEAISQRERRPAVASRVLIVSIDGLRPDLLVRAEVPHIRRLMSEGSYTLWARTVDEAMTLPAHVSMLTGVSPQRHGVTWNRHIEDAFPESPTIFELAKQHGLTTAIVVGKTKFVVLDRPGVIDWKFLPRDEPNADSEVARQAAAIINQHGPRVLFVHLAGVDDAGHAEGWGSEAQRRAVERADEAVGRLLTTLDQQKLATTTVVILTADHGGAGRSHGPDDVRSRTIPWIVRGPGIRRNFDLTLEPGLRVEIVDTFATACALLGIDTSGDTDGELVGEALEQPLGNAERPALPKATTIDGT